MAYAYDQLHRLRAARGSYEFQTQDGPRVTASGVASQYVYDPNGNLRSLLRMGGGSVGTIDDLTYGYDEAGGRINRLVSLTEAAGDLSGLPDVRNGVHRRHYDERGNLDYDYTTRDGYAWRHDGKLAKQRADAPAPGDGPVSTTPGAPPEIGVDYGYDAQGGRLSRNYVAAALSDDGNDRYGEHRTVHIRDAAGTVLATYEATRTLARDEVRTGSRVYDPISVYRSELPNEYWRYPRKQDFDLARRSIDYAYESWFDWVRRAPREELIRFASQSEWDAYVEATGTTPVGFDDYDAFVTATDRQPAQGGWARGPGPEVHLAEVPLYGSSRVGVRQYGRTRRQVVSVGSGQSPTGVTSNVYSATGGGEGTTRTYGERGLNQYEVGNHLGNVLAVVSDFRDAADGRADGQLSGFASRTLSAREYYPFGLEVPDGSRGTVRGAVSGPAAYRFGFNGKEDDWALGEAGIQDYGFRLYDRAIGRFLSVDPLAPLYPFYTPYQFAGNKPIFAIDMDGLEPRKASSDKQGDTQKTNGVDYNYDGGSWQVTDLNVSYDVLEAGINDIRSTSDKSGLSSTLGDSYAAATFQIGGVPVVAQVYGNGTVRIGTGKGVTLNWGPIAVAQGSLVTGIEFSRDVKGGSLVQPYGEGSVWLGLLQYEHTDRGGKRSNNVYIGLIVRKRKVRTEC